LAEYLDINESGVATVIICYILILGAIWGLIRVAAFLINKFIVEHFSKDKIERKFLISYQMIIHTLVTSFTILWNCIFSILFHDP